MSHGAEGVLDAEDRLTCLLSPETRPAGLLDGNQRELGFGGLGFADRLLCNLGCIALLAPVSLGVKTGRPEV